VAGAVLARTSAGNPTLENVNELGNITIINPGDVIVDDYAEDRNP
jgi:hypothetical protein